MSKYAELSNITAEIGEIEGELKSAHDKKHTLGYKIYCLEELFGFVTKFDTALGTFEGYFKTPDGPKYYNSTQHGDFDSFFKELQKTKTAQTL